MEDQTVVLDGKNFEDCAFHRCVLEYSGDPMSIQRTEFNECRLRFRGEVRPLLESLQFLQYLGYVPKTLQGVDLYSEAVH